MIRRLFRAVARWLHNLNHRPVGTRPTRAQRITRVGMATDVRYATNDGQPVRVDVALWEAEMNAHLLMLNDGPALLAWRADA